MLNFWGVIDDSNWQEEQVKIQVNPRDISKQIHSQLAKKLISPQNE